MINKFKRKFKEISKILRVTEKGNLELRKIQGYNVLSNFTFNNIYLPFNSFSLNPDTIVDILNDILLNQRKSIIEFGSGIGTIYIAKLIKMYDLDVKFVSIDSDEEWIATLTKMLEKENLSDYVKLIKVKIVEIQEYNYKAQNKWHDIATVKKIAKDLNTIDMVIVDGPYGQICDFARYSAIPVLKDFLAEKFCVLLDDTNRKVEQEIFNEWEQILNRKGTFHHTYSKIIKQSKFVTEL